MIFIRLELVLAHEINQKKRENLVEYDFYLYIIIELLLTSTVCICFNEPLEPKIHERVLPLVPIYFFSSFFSTVDC